MKFTKIWLPCIIFCIITIAMVALTPETIFYSRTVRRVETDTLILVFIFVLPLIILPFFYRKRFFAFYALFIVFGLTGYYLSTKYRSVQIEKELQTNSKKTYGIVKERHYFSPGKGASFWEFWCEFEYNGYIYSTFWQREGKDEVRLGDTMEIYFLPRNPDISKVVIPQK